MGFHNTHKIIKTLPVTSGQEALWMMHKMSPNSGLYNIHFVWSLGQQIDINCFKKSLLVISDRHPVLRTVYRQDKLGELCQCICESLPINFEIQDIGSLTDEELKLLLDEQLRAPFDLENQMPMRWVLYKRQNEPDVLAQFLHHISVDLWSYVTFFNELKTVYSAFLKGLDPGLLPPHKAYSDFVQQQRQLETSSEGKTLAEFWQHYLAGMEQELNLPLDYPRPSVPTGNKAYSYVKLCKPAVKKFNALLEGSDVPLFNKYLLAFQFLLHRYTQQGEVSVGVPTAGRDESFSGVYGYFTNAVIFRTSFEENVSFRELVDRESSNFSKVLAAQAYPFSLVASSLINRRDRSRAALVQASFVWENINRFENRKNPFVTLAESGWQRWDMGELGIWLRHSRIQQLDDFDITFKVHKLQNDFVLGIEYSADLYKPSTIQNLCSGYTHLLEQLADNPDTPLSSIQVLGEKAEKEILVQWNKTKSYYNPTRSLPFYFDKNVRKRPNEIVLEANGETLTFKQLDDESNKLAARLLDEGLNTESIIGVLLPRSMEAVIAFLGIIKSGMVYLPLDPEYPTDRLNFIVQDAQPAFVVSNQALKGSFNGIVAPPRMLIIEEVLTTAGDFQPDLIQILPEQLAYIIYTSGSTGNPKGVMIEHRAVAHLIHSQNKAFSVGPGDHIPQFSSLNFDISIFELVLALQTGATLHLTTKEHILGGNLLEFLQNKGITWTLLSPALLNLIEPINLPNLKTVIVGGDVCSADLAKRWSKGRTFCNAYGPTEYTVWTSINEVDGTRPPPIGKPVANTQTYILDKHLNPVPIGVPGELHIGGDGLARGYLNRPELTAEKFIANPFSDESGARLYKTGDLCRYLEDGNIEFLGRIDHQVKIRGFRIELGEIEAVLREHPAVHDVLVMARDDFEGQAGGEKQLAAYLVKNASETLDTTALREFLKQKLPDYMVPAAFVVLDAFPLTPNEKIDRKALPAPSLVAAEKGEHKAPRGDIERTLAKVWQAVLGLKDVSVEANFFDLGGHSLLLAQVHSKLPEPLRDRLSMVDLFKYPTIQALSRFLGGDVSEDEFFIEHDHHAERLRLRRRLMDNLGGVKIAIVGMAGRFPGADSVEALWDNICQKRESITFFTPEQLKKAGVPDDLIASPDYVPAKAMLDSISGFEAPFFHFTPREAQITDPQQRLFLECSWEALEDAGCVPARFDGRIGVYAGIGMNQYLMTHLSSRQDLLAAVGDYPMMIGNDKDFLSTRVSYKLNLDGPAMVVQTACSSSLVAVHTACQALLSQDCDAALAGGVSFGRLGKSGYLYQKGMIMSKDGHCRAFDADASGTVQGQGCGVVLLKRLDDALENNDHIYAIISGSATNNDGSNKTGYTAPSVEGQAKAIDMAQASANISPAQISYVEAHGTGTAIGDPIEIEALRHAFLKPSQERGQRNQAPMPPQSCAIGAIKTNIGHLDAASGVAGLIKTAKALEQKQLPPTLHYTKANPKIDFAKSPFYVNTELKPWSAENGPRYAGVSSFGIGGSNAHVVLMDAPNETPAEFARPWSIVTLSARTPTALEAMTERLVAHVKTHPEQSFANVCYTLHVGRTDFDHRRYLVCRSREDALAELSPVNPARVVTSHFQPRALRLVFLFPGQGSQYQNMGKYLYQVELTFRQAIDECRALLKQKFMYIYEELTPEDYYGFSDKIHQTYITQPALFIFEYAIARMLMSWGIQPDLMVGHSIGEYVAACIAGVFTLEEAIDLVAIRGHLIQGLQEKGEMLSVNLPEAEARRLTNHDVCVAAVNGEQRCVLSGTRKAIQYLHLQLEKEGVENRLLHTSHAFHSHMMDEILERFQGYVARRNPKPPKLPFVSTRTGQRITDEEATSAEYWAGHLRDTVQFHKAMETVFATREEADVPDAFICLEIGPGKVLTTLTKQHPGKQPQDWILSTTRHAYEDVSDTEHLLKLIARLWEQGVQIDWDVFHSHRQRYRVPLPTYPFERKRYWVRAQPQVFAAAPGDALEANELDDVYSHHPDAAPQAHGPRTPTERQVWQLWSTALGVESFGIYDDFFDLGGDSLLAVNVIDQLQAKFGLPMASHILIQKPTVESLAEYIRGHLSEGETPDDHAATAGKPGSLVVIQKGAGRRKSGDPAGQLPLPLIMVHPIGGEVFFYRDLGRHLGRNQPVYAFQAASLSGSAPPIRSVKKLATSYIAELNAQEILPPYVLGGSSFGGLVAYEMAQQLTKAGKEVRLLVMVDTPAPEQMPRTLTDSAAIIQYLLAGKLALSLERLRELDESAQIDYVLEQARLQGKGDVLPPHLGVPLFKTWMAHQEATVAYKPSGYHGDVLFFRHTEPMENFPALPHAPWEKLVRGNFYLHQTPGNHITMNYPPHVAYLADHMKPYLDDCNKPVSEEESVDQGAHKRA